MGSRCIIFKLKGEVDFCSESALTGSFEALSYPLLFYRGDRGYNYWTTTKRLGAYLNCRDLMPDLVINDDEDGRIGSCPYIQALSASGNRMVRLNRFSMFASLGQHYVCDNVSRMIDRRLSYVRRNNQPPARDGIGENERHVSNGTGERAEPSNSFLPDSQHGSRRHMIGLSQNALRIVAEYGNPTFFLTVTTNSMWEEIQDNIAEGQTAFDRPGVVVDVFKAKLAALLHNLRSGKYFEYEDANGVKQPAPLVYIMHVIEYQQRGLPHAHIIFRLVGAPEAIAAAIAYVNKYVKAEFPQCSCDDDIAYKVKVKKYMLHR